MAKNGTPLVNTTKPVEVQFNNDPLTIHDIDFFGNGGIDYKFKDIVPLPDGETLALMFPRGAQPKIPAGEQGVRFIKKWYWFWSKYDQIVDILTAKFKYNGLPDEIKPWHIENILNKEGQGAFLKLGDYYIFSKFNIKKKNIYDEPLEISLDVPNSEYDAKVFKAGEFVIIQNQPRGRSTFNDVVQYLEALYDQLEALRLNTFTSQPKGIFLQQASIDEHGQNRPIEMSLNAVANGNKTFYTLSFANQELKFQERLASKGVNDLFLPIEFTDRTDNLIKTAEWWEAQAMERVGLSTSLSIEKKERIMTAELETNNEGANSVLMLKWMVRNEAIEQINKLWGLNITLDEPISEGMEEAKEQQEAGGTDYVAQ